MLGFHIMLPPFAVNTVEQQQQLKQKTRKKFRNRSGHIPVSLTSIPLLPGVAACDLGGICPSTMSRGEPWLVLDSQGGPAPLATVTG